MRKRGIMGNWLEANPTKWSLFFAGRENVWDERLPWANEEENNGQKMDKWK
jgi:hypothetical protein